MNRRAKIVCTLGPATATAEQVRALVDAGMDVARLNLSHGTHEVHARNYALVRAASDASSHAVAVLADLQGPKIRLGRFAGGSAELEPGADFAITVHPVLGDARRASTTYEALPRDVHPGDALLLDDGTIRLEAVEVTADEVRTRVVEGGRISDHKGINLPGVQVSAPALTPRDIEDLHFALSLRVDLVALSFVRSPDDAAALRALLRSAGADVPIVAKIEKPEAVANLEAILDAFDGLMVARGDLGVELPLEQVPLIQKRAILLARERGKPVIVATQMLESMITHSRPTRAEASDVANAALDGADALMLSAETSVGAHPVEAVRVMSRIVAAAESTGFFAPLEGAERTRTPQAAICAAATDLARDIGAKALVAFTESGNTVRLLARHRSPIPLLAFTTRPEVRSQLSLVWGVETFVSPRVEQTDAMVAAMDRLLLELGRGAAGDLVVIVAGTPPGASGSTNTVRVHRLGSADR